MDFFQELTDLVGALERSSIDYALCGGVALAIHGAPRATQDIDLLLRPEDTDRLRAVARACGYTFESSPMDFASCVTIQRFTKLIEAQPFMLDVLLVSPPIERVWAERVKLAFERGTVCVVSRAGAPARRIDRPQARRRAPARSGGHPAPRGSRPWVT
ncbi:MAG: nucleotidyl transferase AbiEii/AbiGii toxin family protein [Myxococcales bacterium]